MQDDRKRKREDSIACPYLGTIRRGVLDFDLEPTCSVTLQTGHVYACLVCGKYFRGKGSNTPAYTHAVEESHFVYVHLETGSFHCLPDNYVVQDASLRDISETLHPSFTPQMIQSLDTNDTTSTDLLGRIYRPGFIGLSSSTDCFNAVVQALIHIPPIRDFFLNPSWNSRQLSTKHAHASAVTQGFGDLVRHVWNDRRFKSSVDPHRFVHVISDKFARQPPEAGEFLAWLLDQLHLGTGGSRKKPQSSVIQRTFQGQVRVTTQKWELPEVKKVRVEDNRLGSDDEEDMEVDKKKPERIKKETVINSHFLHLKLDLDDKPLFRDADGGLVIPQEPLSKLLSKFDGKTQVGNGVDTLRRYELLQLPRYLILHLSRFKLNNYSREKNPTIVIFPMKDLDLAQYVQGPKKDLPSADQIKSMSVKELKNLAREHGFQSKLNGALEKNQLLTIVQTSMDARRGYKYNLVSHVAHEIPADVGREGKHDPLQDGHYKCHTLHRPSKKWFCFHDAHVTEVLPQQVGVSESHVLILERSE